MPTICISQAKKQVILGLSQTLESYGILMFVISGHRESKKMTLVCGNPEKLWKSSNVV